MSWDGISKGHKVDAITKMPPPTNVSALTFIPGLGTVLQQVHTLTELLNHLTRKDTPWRWGAEAQAAFQQLKDILCKDMVLAHFNPALQISISCDASDIGIGVVPFYRYPAGSEHPIAKASETLPLWMKFHSRYGSQTIGRTFQSYEGNACISGKSPC